MSNFLKRTKRASEEIAYDAEQENRNTERMIIQLESVDSLCKYCGYLKPDHEEQCVHGLKNSIGMQLQFYTHSGATLEDTVNRIYKRCMDYLEAKKAQLSEPSVEK